MKRYRFFLSGLCILLLAWAIYIGFTWHMVPVYVSLLVLGLVLLTTKEIKRKTLLTSSILILCGFSLLFLYLLPFVTLPKPTGAYAVGVTYSKVATERDEPFTKTPGDKRLLYLKIWYPAQKGEHPNPYLEEGEKALSQLLESQGLPSFPFHQLAKTKTNSFTNAPIAQGRFPLITFSHGYASWFGQNTSLMEELASQGYIVAAIAHSYQSLFAAADEQTLVNFPYLVPPGDTTEYAAIDTARQALIDKIIFQKASVERTVFDRFFKERIEHDTLANLQARIWADDISSTLDFMLQEHKTSKTHFYNRLDTEKIGAAGMSFGGAAAAEAALKDQRILAAINMDGFQFGSWINDTIKTPILFLEAKRSPQNFSMYGSFFKRSTAEIHCLLFSEADHFNFTDASIFSPILAWIGTTGEVDGEFMLRSMNKIIPDYFNARLSNERFRIEKHVKAGAIEEAVY